MGWASAGEYFDQVATDLVENDAADDLKYQVCKNLIGLFVGEDWDTLRDSLEQFADDPAIVRAFAAHDLRLAASVDD